MKELPYTKIPSTAQWRHDSSVAFAIRSHDIALTRIDRLLNEYHAADQTDIERWGLILCDMFLTLDYWFKMLESRPAKLAGGMQQSRPGNFEPGRLPAMRALFEVVVKALGPFFTDRDDHTPPAVDILAKMKKLFLAGMAFGGLNTDHDLGMIEFDKKQLYKYRVWFKHGIAYQIPWWTEGHAGGKVPANSKHGFVPIMRKDNHGGGQVSGQMNNYSAFIMTLDREIFMTKHEFHPPTPGNNFHSSYNGGKPVTMAGTILIENGVIKGVRTDSGHYKPGLHNLTTFLWALTMYQVNLSRISLYDYAGNFIATADAYLGGFGRSWQQFADGRQKEQDKLDEARSGLKRKAWWDPDQPRPIGVPRQPLPSSQLPGGGSLAPPYSQTPREL